MRTTILLTAATLLAPSLAVYTCPSPVNFDTLLCCREAFNPSDCIKVPRVPDNLDDFLYLCGVELDDRSAQCCNMVDGKADRCIIAQPEDKVESGGTYPS